MPIGVPPCPCVCQCKPKATGIAPLTDKKRVVKDSPALQINQTGSNRNIGPRTNPVRPRKLSLL